MNDGDLFYFLIVVSTLLNIFGIYFNRQIQKWSNNRVAYKVRTGEIPYSAGQKERLAKKLSVILAKKKRRKIPIPNDYTLIEFYQKYCSRLGILGTIRYIFFEYIGAWVCIGFTVVYITNKIDFKDDYPLDEIQSAIEMFLVVALYFIPATFFYTILTALNKKRLNLSNCYAIIDLAIDHLTKTEFKHFIQKTDISALPSSFYVLYQFMNKHSIKVDDRSFVQAIFSRNRNEQFLDSNFYQLANVPADQLEPSVWLPGGKEAKSCSSLPEINTPQSIPKIATVSTNPDFIYQYKHKTPSHQQDIIHHLSAETLQNRENIPQKEVINLPNNVIDNPFVLYDNLPVLIHKNVESTEKMLYLLYHTATYRQKYPHQELVFCSEHLYRSALVRVESLHQDLYICPLCTHGLPYDYPVNEVVGVIGSTWDYAFDEDAGRVTVGLWDATERKARYAEVDVLRIQPDCPNLDWAIVAVLESLSRHPDLSRVQIPPTLPVGCSDNTHRIWTDFCQKQQTGIR